MRRTLLAIAFVLLAVGMAISTHTSQAMLKLIVNFQNAAVCGGSGSTYTGPGDLSLAGTPQVWLGLRAYSRSKANACANLIRIVVNAQSSPTKDVATTTSGDLDIASANTFAGSAGTCQGTISGTTLTVSSCTGTLAQWYTFTGAGINQPAFITTIGSCASPPGTCTINQSQTVAVSETITFQNRMQVITAYDQAGSLCSGPCNYTVGNLAAANLLPNCGGGLPCMYRQTGVASYLGNSTGTYASQPVTISWVANRPSSSQTFDEYFSFIETGFNNATNQVFIKAGSTLTATASDGSWHAVQGIFDNTSSVINVDGTTTSGTAGATNIGAGSKQWGGNQGSVSPMDTEMGILSGHMGSTDQANLCHNQRIYWGTAGSC